MPQTAQTAQQKALPAAVMINVQGKILLDLFRSGMYLYERKDKDHG